MNTNAPTTVDLTLLSSPDYYSSSYSENDPEEEKVWSVADRRDDDWFHIQLDDAITEGVLKIEESDDYTDYIDWLTEHCPGTQVFMRTSRVDGYTFGLRFPNADMYIAHKMRWC